MGLKGFTLELEPALTICNDTTGWLERLAEVRRRPQYIDENEDGWLDGVTRRPAKFCGREGSLPWDRINTIVIHRGVSGGDISRYFQNPGRRRVSAHFDVQRDGLVVQCVPLYRQAWHCKADGYNARSIGIEHQGPIDADFTPLQVSASIGLIDALCHILPIRQIVAHSAVQANRRDPGPYPWDELAGAVGHFGISVRDR